MHPAAYCIMVHSRHGDRLSSDPQPARPGRKVSAAAKRNSGWQAATFYLRPETRLRLQQTVVLLKHGGSSDIQDQSDLIEAALQQVLPGLEREAYAAVDRKRQESEGLRIT